MMSTLEMAVRTALSVFPRAHLYQLLSVPNMKDNEVVSCLYWWHKVSQLSAAADG